MQIELSEQERQILLESLRDYRASLHDEIQHTDVTEYKRTLKEEEEVLDRLIVRLEALAPTKVSS